MHLRPRWRSRHVPDAPPDASEAAIEVRLLMPQHGDPNAAVLIGLVGSLAVMPGRIDFDTPLSMSALLSASLQHLHQSDRWP